MANERRVFPQFSAQDVAASRGRLGLDTLRPDPLEPYLELVFVHSLLGDSRLTWTHGDDGATFWPEWLREDHENFSKTRIHTFGYNESPVNSRVEVSRLWDVGEELCQALESHEDVKSSVHNPIVFVAHALGGLVVKAAIIHARQNVNLQKLGRRFYYIIFLATPHWDAGEHEMLRNILKACNTSAGVRDPVPEPNCTKVQKINDDFYSCSQGLKLCSFFEDWPDPVVSRNRARLRSEKDVAAKADHANIVRFRSSSDPRWDSIHTILSDVAREIKEQFEKPERKQADMRKIAKSLGIAETVDIDFAKHDRDKVPGSCEWLLERDSFKEWSEKYAMAALVDGPRQIYWLSGDPGCGKSVLSAHVISHLRSLDYDTSFFFVKHGDVSKQTMGTLLKTIAYQQAQRSVNVRRALLRLLDDDTTPAQPNDVGAIWRQLFDRGIFQIEPEKCQYWVIDAIDEGHGFEDLIMQLQSLPQNYKVFVTSRRGDPEVGDAFRNLDPNVVRDQVYKNDTLQDIRVYLERYQDNLHEDDTTKLQELIEKLIVKSEGSFLWIHLVMRALRNYWVDDDIDTVLEDVPEDMHSLYSSVLVKISQSPNRAYAKSILRWIICAVRPMTVFELSSAFKLDTKKTLNQPVKAIESICGPLVRLEGDHVEVVHDTVRDYLFNKGQDRPVVEGFKFDKAESHERLAIICVAFIADRFSHRARVALSSSAVREDPFLSYANDNFSEHLAKGGWAAESNDTKELVKTLVSFFRGCVLYWIEYLAQEAAEEGLTVLTNAGKNLKAFVARRIAMNPNPAMAMNPSTGMAMKPKTAMEKQLEELQEWSDDLIHIVTVFGKELLKRPEAIRNVIPPLCPLKAKINSEVGNLGVGLQVVGNPHDSWPERINSTSFADDYVTALAASEKRYAVALRSKQIVIYAATTCQETLRIETEEVIKRLQFAHGRNLLIACGRTSLSAINYETGEKVLSKETANEVLALAVTRDDSNVVTVTRAKDLESFDIKGERPVRRKHLDQSNAKQPPQKAYISEELGLLALLARNEDVELYDLDTLHQPKARISHAANIDTMAFNNMKRALAMSSFDGELFTVEAQSLRRSPGVRAHASHMAVSPDGKTLIIGTNKGAIEIREFDWLDLVHTLPYEDEEVVGLCFASSSLRFLDIRRQVFNVWEPAALVRRNDVDDSRSSAGQSFTSAASQRLEVAAKSDKSAITAMIEHQSGEYVFCAKESGAISVYETSKAKPKLKLFDFGKSVVLFLAWNEPLSLLASADNSGTVKVHRLGKTPQRVPGGTKDSWQPHPKQILQTKCKDPVRQLLFSQDGNLLLVSTMENEHIFSTKDGTKLRTYSFASSAQRFQKWIACSWDKRRLLEVESGPAHAISWEKGTPPSPVLEVIDAHDRRHYNGRNAHLVLIGDTTWAAYDSNPRAVPVVWSMLHDTASAETLNWAKSRILDRFADIAPYVLNILGMYRRRLIFLGSDNWICSIGVDEPTLEEVTKYHFPLPPYWSNATRTLRAFVSSKGDVVIALDADLTIIRRAL